MKIALIGYGKMGKSIERIAIERGHEIVLIIDHDNLNELNQANLKLADVAIEFTRPEAAVNNLKLCIDAEVPVVCGTTGWLEKFEELSTYCQKKDGTVMYSSNFSLGVNIFFKLNKLLAEMMDKFPQYDTSIEEIHHIQKVDAPSGTAITLAEGIISTSSRLNNWVKEKAQIKSDLPIYSIREDSVPGTHIIKYQTDIDTIEIKHTAHSREGFALGAVTASEWIVGKKGIFTMQDMLNL
jgi:4-hydroxy-tetrahydrodipicolinate reductase